MSSRSQFTLVIATLGMVAVIVGGMLWNSPPGNEKKFSLAVVDPIGTTIYDGKEFAIVSTMAEVCVTNIPANSNAGIDSIFWCFRLYDIPGVFIEDSTGPNLDPIRGWVHIGTSLVPCTYWETDWYQEICDRGLESHYQLSSKPGFNDYFTVAAWIFTSSSDQPVLSWTGVKVQKLDGSGFQALRLANENRGSSRIR